MMVHFVDQQELHGQIKKAAAAAADLRIALEGVKAEGPTLKKMKADTEKTLGEFVFYMDELEKEFT